MTIQTTLPRVNELGYYEMRLESIGGLGANLCGKLLGELGAVQLGLNAASFSSYGSEKRGSPVKAFIRYSAKKVHAAARLIPLISTCVPASRLNVSQSSSCPPR